MGAAKSAAHPLLNGALQTFESMRHTVKNGQTLWACSDEDDGDVLLVRWQPDTTPTSFFGTPNTPLRAHLTGPPPPQLPTEPPPLPTERLPLPEGWAEVPDANGNVYFWNQQTGETSCCAPMATSPAPSAIVAALAKLPSVDEAQRSRALACPSSVRAEPSSKSMQTYAAKARATIATFNLQEAASSLTELHTLCREATAVGGPSSSADSAVLSARVCKLKAEMLTAARHSHALQSELHELARLIALHIRHRMEVEDKLRARLDGRAARSPARACHQAALSADERSKFETLTFLIRVNPWWQAELLMSVEHRGRPQLLHLILNVLYADMHNEDDDMLLLALFGEALEREVQKAADKATFMRDNTALTELMSRYNQREPGREALVAVLQAPIKALLAEGDDFSLEVQPLAVYRELLESGVLSAPELDPISCEEGAELVRAQPDLVRAMPTRSSEETAAIPEVAIPEVAIPEAAIPEVAAEVARRLERARGVATVFLEALTSPAAIEALPFGTRWIAKTVFTLAKKRFGATTDADARSIYSLLGGFVFLRYINPRIVAPETIGLARTAPSKQMRRNLIIVAKILQALSNHVLFGHLGKETELAPLNPFITANAPRLWRYFDALMAVPELSLHELQLHRYLSTLRAHEAQRFVRISLSELHQLHALMIAHKADQIHPAAREALSGLPPPPDAKIAKEDDCELSLNMAPPVALQLEEDEPAARGGAGGLGRSGLLIRGAEASQASKSLVTGDASVAGIHSRGSSISGVPLPPIVAVGAEPSAAAARLALRSLLCAVPEVPPLAEELRGAASAATEGEGAAAVTWAALHTELTLRAAMATPSEHGEPSCIERLGTFNRELARLQGVNGSLNHARLHLSADGAAWPLVFAANDEAQGVRYLHRQLARYESSAERLRSAAAALEENIQMYMRTLEAVRPSVSGGKGGSLPAKYVCTSDKLQKKELFAKGTMPEIEGVNPKLVAKYWPRASFTFELKAQGEINISAVVRGRVMWEASLRLDELLKMSSEGVRAVEEEGVEIQVKPLLQLIDDKFYAPRKPGGRRSRGLSVVCSFRLDSSLVSRIYTSA